MVYTKLKDFLRNLINPLLPACGNFVSEVKISPKFDRKKIKADFIYKDGEVSIKESENGRYSIHLWDGDKSGRWQVGDVIDTKVDEGEKAVELLSSYLSKELNRIEKEYGIGLLWAKEVPPSNDRKSPIELSFYKLNQ